MTKVHKNAVSFSLGSCFIFIFLWLAGFVAALPVPNIAKQYNEFSASHYSNILMVLFSTVIAFIIIIVARKILSVFTRQNLMLFAIPIILFLVYISIFANFAAVTLVYAAVPTLLIASILSKGETKVR